MQEDNTDNASLSDAPVDEAVAKDNDTLAEQAKAAAEQKVQSIDEQLGNVPKKVAEKIKACENILIAMSQSPSVDEISAAIGLTMVINKLGKHVTAIYSGETPNTLEFLKPEETFEKDTNSLQDFIIALNKDKADHLRYKIEGDYVKVFITPYKTTISQNDLEFSQGDFNVDLVISINVDSAEVLDAALEEYGRIMHDATAINITTNQAGHFAELEWTDPSKSSVCEMIVNLCEYLDIGDRFDQPTATALLTGIVSATERFSNARTTSETMQIASKLMQDGADQQLISSNIMQPEAKPAEEAPKEEAPAPVEEKPAEPAAPAEPLIPAPTLGQPAPAPAPEQPAPAAEPAPETPAPEAPAPEAQPTPEAQLEQAVVEATPTGMAPDLANELANATPEPAPEQPAPAPEAPAPAPAPEAPAPAPETEILVGIPAPVEKAPAPSLEPAGPEGLAAPTSVTPDPIQAPAPENSSTFTLPGQTSPDDVQAAMNAILNPGEVAEEKKEDGNALPQIVSQGSVMSQNVAEPIPETPDYGALIDEALTEAMQAPQPVAAAQPAPANPAVSAAPAVDTQAQDVASVPTLDLNPAAPAPTPEAPAPVAETPVAVPEVPVAPEAVAEVPAVPAAPAVPEVPAAPEVAPAPVDVPAADVNIELPPPPAPAIDGIAMPPAVAEAPDPAVAPAPEAPAPAPEAQPAPEAAQAPADPSAFQIPQA